MGRIDQEEGRPRVFHLGSGGNREKEKDCLCDIILKHYRVPFLPLKKIVDRYPFILKNNLPLRKTELPAKTSEWVWSSRMTVQWMSELIPEVARIYSSNTSVLIDRSLYRVAAL
jgi:hypothetical protein